MFECINFDEYLAEFVSEWMTDHSSEYKNFDAMEADMPNIYVRFLNKPASWLQGLTPGAFFTQYEDPKDLVDWLKKYTDEGVPVPELLCEQIENVGKPCEKRLVALLKDEEANADAKMTAISILRNLDSTQPKMLYISWQLNRSEDDELAENGLESLSAMGRSAVQPMLEALPKANDAGQIALLDVLCRYPGNEQVYSTCMRLFQEKPEKKAILASYLGRLQDERALPVLMDACLKEDLNYLDYLELRSAIEELGGTAPERDYTGDPAYEALEGIH
ncbi:MAG: hypothetical protein IJ083_09780 [Clostridia bacterium]|nr:hypothetical protein [Clostridia bacterium]